MEYTKDIILGIKYKNNKTKAINNSKHKMFRKIVDWVKKDEYFTMVILTSIVVLTIDFLVVKKFVDILKLL